MTEAEIQKMVAEVAEKAQRHIADARNAATKNVDAIGADALELQRKQAEAAEAARRNQEALDAKQVDEIVARMVAEELQKHRTPVSTSEDAKAPGQVVDRTRLKALLNAPSQDPQIRELQDAVCDLKWARALVPRGTELPAMTERANQAARALGIEVRDITTTGAGTGDEWAFDEQVNVPIPRVNINGMLAQAFIQYTVPMGRESLTVPGYGARVTGYTVGEGASITESTPGTRQVTFAPKKHAAFSQVTDESLEDLIIAVLPDLQRQMAEEMGRFADAAIISGDTASGMDSDQAAGDVYAAWDGLRHKIISDIASGAGATDQSSTSGILAVLKELRQDMGIYGVNPGDLVAIVGPAQYAEYLDDADMKTLDLIGGRATVLTGAYSQAGGVQFLVSDQFREDLNASGVYDGVTTTKRAILLVNRRCWGFATKRGLRLEMDKNIQTQLHDVAATARRDFKLLYATTEQVAAYGYNLA